MAAHVSADAVSAIAVLAQITLMIQAVGTGLAVGVTMMVSNIATGICSALVVIPVIREIRRISQRYEAGESGGHYFE